MSRSVSSSKIVLVCLNRMFHNCPKFKVNAVTNLQILKSGVALAAMNFNRVCWKCGVERKSADLFCEKCDIIQTPIEKMNYFKIFNMDEEFRIDIQDLRDKYRKLQTNLHPDKFSNKSQEEQSISMEYSSLINKAYSTLQAPLKRAEHLLNLRGETIPEENQTINDPNFLIKVMTLNEEVEASEDDPEKLKVLDRKNKAEMEKLAISINNSFKSNDITKAKELVIKLKYYTSINNRIHRFLRELGITD